MADEIRQDLGFNAAQALETLSKLNREFDSLFQTVSAAPRTFNAFNSTAGRTVAALTQIQTRATQATAALNQTAQPIPAGAANQTQQLTAALTQLNATLNQTAAQAARTGRAFTNNTGQAAQSVARLTTSVQLLSRIAFTQFVIRQLRILRTTFQETAQSAADFQRRVAEIQTIANGENFAQIAGQVRSISDNLNIDLLETAAGTYQALSNNIGDFSDSLKLTESAAKFAKATNSTLAQSVDLLSAAINSYGLTVDDADRLSGQFFETIRLGRVSATELANQFGRVAPRAAELGISLEEVNAALATTTTTGLKSSEAVTLLNGVITGLTKSTPEMRKALEDLGFSSAEAAVQTLGLPKLLQSLIDRTDGTSASLAKLFPNVRGIGGALALTGDHLRTFAQGIEDGRKAGAAFAQEKFLTATATDAERVTKEINKLRNALTVDLGQGLLKAAADASQFVGGADGVVTTFKILTPVVLASSAALLGYAASSRAAATASALLATRLGPVGVALAALGAASSVGRGIDAAFFSDAVEGFRDFERASKKSLEDFQKNEAEKVQAADRANEERVRLALQSVADLNRAYLKDVDNARTANDALVKNTKNSVADIIRTRERLVDALARSADDARDLFADSQERVFDLGVDRNDARFESSIRNLGASQQSFELTRRASAVAAQASRALLSAASAGDDRALQRALRQFDEAREINARAADTARQAGSRNAELNAVRQIQQLDNQRIKAEQRLQRLQQQRVAALDAERTKQQAIVDQTRAAGKLLLDNLSQFGADGKQLPQDQLTERAANRQKALAELTKLAFSDKDFDAAQALGLADFVSRFESELQKDPVTLAFTVNSETERIKAQVTQSFDRFSVKLNFDTSELEGILDRRFRTPDEVSQGLSEARNRANEIRQQLAGERTGQKAETELLGQISEVEKTIDRVQNGLSKEFSSTLSRSFAAFVSDFKTISRAAEITDDDIQRLLANLQAAQQQAQGFAGIGRQPQLLEDFAVIIQALPLLKQLQSQRSKAIEVSPETRKELERIESFLKRVETAKPFQATSNALSSGAAFAERIAASFERAAVAAGRLRLPTVAASAPRSVETQVQQQLGNTTSFGDINVTVQGGGSATATARDIAIGIRRELRRGTVSIV